MKVKITKEWPDPKQAGKAVAVGTVLDLADDSAKTLVSCGYGEKVAEAGDVKGVLDEALAGLEAGVEKAVARGMAKGAKGFKFDGTIAGGRDREIDADPTFGYKSIGEQLRDVKAASAKGATPSERLQKIAKAHGGTEGVGSEGGFLLAPGFSNRMLERIVGELDFLGQCDVIPTLSNSVEVTAYIDHDRSGTTYRYAGVVPYWIAEAAQIAASKPKWRKERLELHKIAAVVPMSDELLEDVPGMGERVTGKMGGACAEEILYAVLFGDGIGKPKGVFTGAEDAADCPFVAIAKETDQGAATIKAQNILKMFARLHKGRGRILYNPGCFVQLATMTITVGVGGAPVWLPANGLANQPNQTLLGLRCDSIDLCAALGSKGDIVAVDPSQIIVARKGGPQTAISQHLYFDYDETAFRVTQRVGAMAAWDRPLTPRAGADTVSPFVCLKARA